MGAPVLIDFIHLLNIYAGIRAKKSKAAFKSVGVPRRNLSVAYSALTRFYSRERTANCRADDLWFDNCFRTRKPLALHWTGTGLLYFFFPIFSLFYKKKNLLRFGKELRVQEWLVSSPAASASRPCQRLSGNPSLFWANFSGSCCPQGPHRHSLVAVPPCLGTSNNPSLPWKVPSASFIALYQPLSNGIVSPGKPHHFPLAFHPWAVLLSYSGSQHLKITNSIPKVIPCPVWVVTPIGTS